ncbi:MAG: permease prefix domain 1-containing protein [Candidatus Fimenecus sp.]
MFIPQFEEYLQYVCAGIQSHRKRAEIHDELLGHLEDNYERALATGHTAAEAENEALTNMGDREVLRGKFALLYKFSPPEYMRSTVNCLIFGLLFVCCRVDVIPLFGKFMPIIGQILLLFALFRLYRFNKPLKAAAGILAAYLLCQNAAWFITVYDMPQNVWRGCFSVAAAVFLNVFCCALYIGIQTLCEQQSGFDTDNLFLYFCILPQLWVAYCTVVISWNSEPLLSAEYAYCNMLILLGLIFPVIGLWRAKRILSRTEPEFPLERPLEKPMRTGLSVCIVLCLLLPLGSMVAAATRAPQTEIYTVADTDVNADTVANTRAHLRALGLPETVLQDLPDSEVLHYRTAQYMDTQENPQSSDGRETGCTAYIFYLNGLPAENDPESINSNGKYVRVLTVFSGFDERTFHFRDGIYLPYSEEPWFRFSALTDTDFFLLLSDKDGQAVSANAFSRWSDLHDGTQELLTGYDFAFPHGVENRRMYIASTALYNDIIDSGFHLVAWSMHYYRQVLPSNITYRCNHERFNSEFIDSQYSLYYGNHLKEVDEQVIWFMIDVTSEKFGERTE